MDEAAIQCLHSGSGFMQRMRELEQQQQQQLQRKQAAGSCSASSAASSDSLTDSLRPSPGQMDGPHRSAMQPCSHTA